MNSQIFSTEIPNLLTQTINLTIFPDLFKQSTVNFKVSFSKQSTKDFFPRWNLTRATAPSLSSQSATPFPFCRFQNPTSPTLFTLTPCAHPPEHHPLHFIIELTQPRSHRAYSSDLPVLLATPTRPRSSVTADLELQPHVFAQPLRVDQALPKHH